MTNQEHAEILIAKLSEVMPSGPSRASIISTISKVANHPLTDAAASSLDIFEHRIAATRYHTGHFNYIDDNCLLCKR